MFLTCLPQPLLIFSFILIESSEIGNGQHIWQRRFSSQTRCISWLATSDQPTWSHFSVKSRPPPQLALPQVRNYFLHKCSCCLIVPFYLEICKNFFLFFLGGDNPNDANLSCRYKWGPAMVPAFQWVSFPLCSPRQIFLQFPQYRKWMGVYFWFSLTLRDKFKGFYV